LDKEIDGMNNESEYYEQFGGLSCSEPDDKPSFSDADDKPSFSDADDKPSLSDDEEEAASAATS
jgi:hypothetical protein